MIKVTLATLLLLGLADLTIEDGAHAKRLFNMIDSTIYWVAHVGDGLVFDK